MPAPFLETPPNPVDESKPAKLRSSRFGELDEHELIRLLDTLDDERSKARFRESVYISLFVYVIIGWFVLYGPRVLFHQPRLVSPFDVLKQREMTNLETPSDIAKHLHQAPKPVVKPQIDQKTLQAMRKAAAAAAAKPTPAPPAPESLSKHRGLHCSVCGGRFLARVLSTRPDDPAAGAMSRLDRKGGAGSLQGSDRRGSAWRS